MSMDFDGPGFGPWGGHWLHILSYVIGGFIWLLAIALMLAVLFFLIRFLLVATRAAQLYVSQHAPVEPARTSTPAATIAPAASTTSATTTPTATTKAATKPVTTPGAKPPAKPRTPRTPPPPTT